MAGWAAEASGDRQEAQRFAGGEEGETCRALGSRFHDHGVLCLPQTSKVVVPVPTSRWRNRGLEDAWGPSRKRLKPGPKPGPPGLHCPRSSRHGGIHRPPVYSVPSASVHLAPGRFLGPVPQPPLTSQQQKQRLQPGPGPCPPPRCQVWGAVAHPLMLTH